MTTINLIVKKFKDIDLTLQINPLTSDVNTKQDAEAIKASLKNLLMTMNYERPFHPEIGSPIYGLLFEPATPVTANVLQTVIKQTIEAFEPRAQLNFVHVNPQPDYNSYDVTVNFNLANYYQPFEVKVLLQRLR